MGLTSGKQSINFKTFPSITDLGRLMCNSHFSLYDTVWKFRNYSMAKKLRDIDLNLEVQNLPIEHILTFNFCTL